MAGTTNLNTQELAPSWADLISPQDPKKKLLLAMALQGTDTSPVQHWTQGAARVANALMGNYELFQEDQKQKAGEQDIKDFYARKLQEATGEPVPAPIGGATGGGILQQPLPPPGPPMPPGKRMEVMPSPTVWGDKEAEAAGLYEPPQRGGSPVVAALGAPPPAMPPALVPTQSERDIGRLVLGNAYSNRPPVAAVGAPPPPTATPVASPPPVAPQPVPPGAAPYATSTGGPPMPPVGQPGSRSYGVISPETAARLSAALQKPATMKAAAQEIGELTKLKEQEIPLLSKEDRAAAGIQPTDTNPYTINSVTRKISPVNPQPFAVNVNQQGQSEFEKTYGKGIGEQALNVVERGNNAAVQQQKIMLAQRMLQDIQTGKLTPAQSTIGGYMQAFGMDPKALGIDPKLPMTAEALNGLTADLVTGKIGPGGFPANNFSEADRKFVVGGVFNLLDRPEANFIKLEVARRVAQLDQAKADAWAEARANKQSYEDFDREWRKRLGQTSVFGDLIEQAKAFQSARAGGGTNVRVYNPATGKIE